MNIQVWNAESENPGAALRCIHIMAVHVAAAHVAQRKSWTGGIDMAQWSTEKIQAFAEADDLHVSPFREDGKTYGTPTWIWSVVVDGSLYARAVHGTKSSWNHAAVTQGAGRITLAGGTYEVTFTAVTDQSLWDRIDEAYREKYAGSPYLKDVTGPVQRESTVRIDPKE